YWRDYARRMYESAEIETRPTHFIRRAVDQILGSAATSAALPADEQERRIARLYDFLQNEIHNVGQPADRETPDVEAGLKKNVRIDDTLRRKYGTPRDINRLFIAMLRAARFDARVAELTTRDENFFHRSFPDGFQLNGEVAVV